MSSLSSRAFGRRHVAVLVVAALALTSFVLVRARQADAAETKASMKMQCLVGGAITVNYTINHTPPSGPIAGQVFTLHTSTVVELAATTPDVPVNGLTITIPNPAGLTPGGEVTLEGGNLTKVSEAIEGSNLILKMQANAGVTTKSMVTPAMSIPVMVPASLAGQPITFQGPSLFQLGIKLLGQDLTEQCTAAADNPPLLVTPAVVSPTTTTTTTTTTTRPPTTTTTTTRPPTTTTTTTRPPTTTTTTTRPPTTTTTTTRPPTTTTTTTVPPTTTTTTTRPPTTTTTTTRPPTTTTTIVVDPTTTTTKAPSPTTTKPSGGDDFLTRLIKAILCFLFRLC